LELAEGLFFGDLIIDAIFFLACHGNSLTRSISIQNPDERPLSKRFPAAA
jgi:hypothetical protein